MILFVLHLCFARVHHYLFRPLKCLVSVPSVRPRFTDKTMKTFLVIRSGNTVRVHIKFEVIYIFIVAVVVEFDLI